MERFPLEELIVIDRRACESLQYCRTLIPEGWFALVLLLSGAIDVARGENMVKMSAGELMVIAPSCEIIGITGNLVLSAVGYSSDFAISNKMTKGGKGYLDYVLSLSQRKIILSELQEKRLSCHFKRLRKVMLGDRTVFQTEIILLWFNLVLYEFSALFAQQYTDILFIANRKERIFIRFIELVQWHCRKEHKVKFYADSLFVTTGYLGRIIKEVSLKSAKHFIEVAIVSEAYMLLSDQEQSISNIAEELNFTSTSSFSSFFKRYTQMSPSSYREGM